jgi:hypothetical protein
MNDSVTIIGESAFSDCISLQSLKLSDNITIIGDSAFSDCTSLESIIIPDKVTIIGDSAFSDCTSLESIIIPDKVTIIGDSAFSGTNLKSIIIPDSVTEIGAGAFSDCINLESVKLPSSINIQDGTFANCPLSVDTVKSMLDNFTNDQLLAMGIPNETIEAACFSEDTNILCLNSYLNEEYIPVKNLKKGDLVKTYLHGYRKINIMCKGLLRNNINEFRSCMYKMKKTDENGLIDDLVVTGGHSIMVDELTKEEYDETFNIWKICQVDHKYLLMAGVSDKFEQIQGTEIFKYYHFSLENDGNPEKYYGVYANGVLVETPSENDIKTFKNVEFI